MFDVLYGLRKFADLFSGQVFEQTSGILWIDISGRSHWIGHKPKERQAFGDPDFGDPKAPAVSDLKLPSGLSAWLG